MYKNTILLILVILVCSCATDKRAKTQGEAVKGSDDYLGEEGIKEFETDPAVLVRQTNRVKCQVARMDMVDAEAKGDEGEIRFVKARLQKYCLVDE